MFISFIVICLMLSGIVFIHEFGHFLAARFYKIPVYTFSIGFGPSILSFTDKKNTIWQIAAIPLGGYVQIPPHDLFGFKKIIIALAGPLMNFILSFTIFFIMIFNCGLLNVLPTIKEITPNSLAQKYNLQPQDEIITVNNQPITFIQNIIKTSSNVTLKIKRQGKIIIKHIPLTEPKLGIMFNSIIKPATILESAQTSFLMIITICKKITSSLLSFSTYKNMGGLISVVSASQANYQSGWQSFLSFTGLLSVNLGFINLLPIPILDGGNVIIGIFESLTKRRLKEMTYQKFIMIGIFIILSMMTMALLNDIFRRV